MVLARLGDSNGPMLVTKMGVKLGSRNNIGGWWRATLLGDTMRAGDVSLVRWQYWICVCIMGFKVGGESCNEQGKAIAL